VNTQIESDAHVPEGRPSGAVEEHVGKVGAGEQARTVQTIPCAVHRQSLQPSGERNVSPTARGTLGVVPGVMMTAAPPSLSVPSHEHPWPSPVGVPSAFLSRACSSVEPTAMSPELHPVASTEAATGMTSMSDEKTPTRSVAFMSMSGRSASGP
jgi:hypothetical protein